MPIDVAAVVLDFSDGVETENVPTGGKIYMVGKYTKLDEANKMKANVVQRGIKDAFIVAFKDGKRIDLAEAKRLTGQ